MPRCCASINDPNNPAQVVVYVQIDTADEVAGQAAAEAAALAAFQASEYAAAPPQVAFEVKPGQINKQ